ncbi:hypothetical protein GIB67_021716 [Kingdonia uniflora]|uniref:Uncharacterized protein n=1 Tax=Kingdonia uniflora TaxID=39325 RepID=A0A7J7LM30_9MAGN|nr:hypothetical protein GIB67_021716 [Kingdonia uniflora]
MKPSETDMQQGLIQEVMYQFSTPEKTVKRKQKGGNEKEDGKRKKAEPRTKKCKGEWQKKAEEADVPNKKKKKTLISKIPKKGLANRVPRKRRVEFLELENIQSIAKNLLQQVLPREGLEVVNDLMVDDDDEVGREVNFKAISYEYGGDLLEWKKGDEKDNDEKKDVEEKVKSEEQQPQVAKEEDSEPPTVVTMAVVEVAKTDIVFFNQEEVIGEAYQASVDQTTIVFVKEQTLEVKKTKDEASHASADQTTVVSVEEQTIESKKSKEEVEQNKEEVVEGKDDDDGNLQNKPDPEQVINEMVVDQTNLISMESDVDVTLKKRHALTEEEINERAFKMAYQMNQLHAHPNELLLGVLLESFIKRPISQDEKN